MSENHEPTATTPTLDCDDCGKALMALSPAEAQRVALEPYNHIVYCSRCEQDRRREQNGSQGAR